MCWIAKIECWKRGEDGTGAPMLCCRCSAGRGRPPGGGVPPGPRVARRFGGGAAVIITPRYRMRSLKLAEETIDQLEAVRPQFHDERQREMLDVVLEHIRYEWLDLDIDGTMATMAPNPQALVYGAGKRDGLNGYDAIRRSYERQFTFGTNGGGMEFERIVMDGESFVMQGNIVQIGPVVADAWPEMQAIIDPNRVSLVRKHAMLLLPFEDRKIAGEFCYFDGGYTAEDVVYVD
jgi:hypothetical protein